MTYPGPTLPAHAWRALHSGLVDEVLKADPDTCLAVNERLCGLGWESFGLALHHKTLRTRLVPVTLDDAWVTIDYAHTPGDYTPLVQMRCTLLGVNAKPLVRDYAEHLGIPLDDIIGSGE